MKMRFREFLESIDSSWEYDDTHGDIVADAAEHLAQYDQQQQRIRELEQIANEAIDTIEDMAGGPCYPSLEYRKRLEPSNEN